MNLFYSNRSSILGNNHPFKPGEHLISMLHDKTYFKASVEMKEGQCKVDKDMGSVGKEIQMKFQDISRHMKQVEQAKDKKGERISHHAKMNAVRKAIKQAGHIEIKDLDSEAAKEIWDRENKKEGLEEIEVQELTLKILKYCNVIRDKKEESKMLLRKTGVVCGAKNGAAAVNEPLLTKFKQRIMSANPGSRHRNGQTKFKSVVDSSMNFASTALGFTSEPQSVIGSRV